MQAMINGVGIEGADAAELRNAAIHELLRQEAVGRGLVDTVANEQAVVSGIELLLEREIVVPDPTEEELRRHYAAHASRYASGELVIASHILLQMTPGMPVMPLLARAESILHQAQANPTRFEQLARENSNCPSSETGGSLGQLQRGDTVPEFEATLFADNSVGLWPAVVRTRFGFHVLRIDRREAGRQLPFDMVRERVARDMRQQSLARALHQFVRLLAGHSQLEGVDLGGVGSPLVN